MFDPINIEDTQTNINWQFTPLFPKPVSISFVEEECCNMLKEQADSIHWVYDAPNSGSINSGVSANRYVLNQNNHLKEYLLEFCSSGLKILGYDNEIQISTSWFTLTCENGMSREHKHTNSWYSAVLYFDDYDDTSSVISFSEQLQQIHVEPSINNYMNSCAFKVHPAKGMLLMFPSETMHQVAHGLNSNERRSLAFNMMPKGETGSSDSTFSY
tara:strand:- start:305 stop:946 length:642 start_codon:yes stop_codon:yes gene_type:complete